MRYRYCPDYLSKGLQQYMTDPKDVCDKLREAWWAGVVWQELELVVDGGNVVKCGDIVVNFLQTEQVIVVPGLGIEEDAEALEQLRRLFPEYGERVVQVDVRPLVKRGGAWNCISWNVKRFK